MTFKTKRQKLKADGFEGLGKNELTENIWVKDDKCDVKCSSCGLWNPDKHNAKAGDDVIINCGGCDSQIRFTIPSKQYTIRVDGSDKGILPAIRALLKKSVDNEYGGQ